MSILLTEQEVVAIAENHGLCALVTEAGYKNDALWFEGDKCDFARAIQLALIEKLRKAPACYVYPDFFQCIEVAGTWTAYLRDAVTPDAPNGREPLYRLPTPQELENES